MRSCFLVSALAIIAMAGCASDTKTEPGRGDIVQGDDFARAAVDLARCIPAGARVAIALPTHQLPSKLAQQIRTEALQHASSYSVRMEGSLAEALHERSHAGVVPKVVTRVHLDPILEEADLQWGPLAEDSKLQARLAELTKVDTLITWHIALEGENAISNGHWDYKEMWTLQGVRITTGELLGSLTLRRAGRLRIN